MVVDDQEVQRGKSYTIDTVNEYRKKYDPEQMVSCSVPVNYNSAVEELRKALEECNLPLAAQGTCPDE